MFYNLLFDNTYISVAIENKRIFVGGKKRALIGFNVFTLWVLDI